jgi:hypothetical protein
LKVKDGDYVEADAIIFEKSNNQSRFAETDGEVSLYESHLNLSGVDYLFDQNTSVRVQDKQFVKRGDLLLSYKDQYNVLESLGSFAQINAMIDGHPTGHYNILAQEDGKVVETEDGVFFVGLKSRYAISPYYHRLQIVKLGPVQRGELIAYGTKGAGPDSLMI